MTARLNGSHRAIGEYRDRRAGQRAGARAQSARRSLHAYPSVDNGPSNGICPTLGFTLMGKCSFGYPPGHPLVCNDWRLDLRAAG